MKKWTPNNIPSSFWGLDDAEIGIIPKTQSLKTFFLFLGMPLKPTRPYTLKNPLSMQTFQQKIDYLGIMEDQKAKNRAEKPFTDYGSYTYADYLTWQFDEMVELIRGKMFKSAAAAPRRIHQEISIIVSNKLYNFLKGEKCKVYSAPFDVRLPVKSKKHEDIDTVVQPDICVVCDPEKLDDLGCIGAPDLIVEILSPGNNRKELQNKYEVYEESGIKEYWIIHPEERTLLTHTLENGRYIPSRLFTLGDVITSTALPDFTLDLDEVFGDLS